MCGVCGCGNEQNGPVLTKIESDTLQNEKIMIDHPHDHHHHHGHTHEHGHAHNHDHHEHKTVVELEKDILHKNQIQAERNRGYFNAKKMFAINMVSSPGSGKTSILERTLNDLKNDIHAYVIEGDQQTLNDALRIEATNTPVVQVNTGQGCHLESDMIFKALNKLEPSDHGVLFIENVGNLVCPAMFDLGESARIVIMSVTEGDDKPIKYPDAFLSSQYCLINKIDLLPYVNFDVGKAKKHALQINPNLKFFELSATTGEGMNVWYNWIKKQII